MDTGSRSDVLGGLVGLWLTAPFWGANVILFCLAAFKLANDSHQRRIVLCLISLQLVVATAHVFSCLADLISAFVTSGKNPADYFHESSRPPEIVQEVLYPLNVHFGDYFLIWRVYVLWECRLLFVLPLLALNVGTLVFGWLEVAWILHFKSLINNASSGLLATSWACTLCIQCSGAFLIGWRVWSTPSVVTTSGTRWNAWTVVWVAVESGCFYSLTTLAAVACRYLNPALIDIFAAPLCQIAAFVPLTIILREYWKTEHKPAAVPFETFLVDERELNHRLDLVRSESLAETVVVNIQTMTHTHADKSARKLSMHSSESDSEAQVSVKKSKRTWRPVL